MNKFLTLLFTLVVGFNLQINAQATDNSALEVRIQTNDDQPLSDVLVSIDSYIEKKSDANGMLILEHFDSNKKPQKITATKDGYELSTWSLNNNVLTVFMRIATIRTIKGLLVDINNIPMPKTTVLFLGNPVQTITTDNQGNYELKIAIQEPFDPNNLFEVKKQKVSIENMSKRGNSVILNLKYQDANYIIYSVSVFEQDNAPHANKVITIGGESYLTNSNGKFRMSSFKDPNVKWNFNGRTPLAIDTLTESNEIVVSLAPKTGVTTPLAIQPDTASPLSTGQEIINGIGILSSFYIKEEQILKNHKSKIDEISSKLPSLTDVNEDEKTQLNSHMDQLNETMEQTTRAFEETKNAHRDFILTLQRKLMEKELVIQEIEEEKEELVVTNRLNIKLFLTILTITLIVLGIVTWIMRKFRAKNKIIEQTKLELLRAQKLAKIGNMVYNNSGKTFSYSDNFLNTLQISNPLTVSKLNEKTNGMLPEEIVATEDREMVIKKWKEGIKNKSTINVEFKSNSDSDSHVFIDMVTVFETDNSEQIQGISSTLQDVTLKKENELRLLSAIQETKAANKVKEEFLAAMSHEIRTPLNAIIGLTNRLISDNPTQNQAKNLNIIKVSSEHLLALLNDVLDFSKIQAGKVQLEHQQFNLAEVVINTTNAMMYSAHTKDVELILSLEDSMPEVVKSDKVRINQIIINLMSNAIKFTNKGSITVNVSATPYSDSDSQKMIRFSVKDTGIGIAPEKFDAIFESFEQESSATARKYGGTGLGLSISKNLVQLLGGELNIKSELNKGTEFYFSIPLEEVKIRPQNKNQTEIIRDLSDIKILCVEDNEINQVVASQYFDILKVNSTFANCGKEAIDLIKNETFDMILMDIRLPDMTGYDVCKKIKQDLPTCTTPIVAFTAEFDFSSQTKFKESGMIDYIGKPFKEDELYKIILKHIDFD